MKKFVAYGSDIVARSCRCADCGHILLSLYGERLPPCPELEETPHHQRGWYVLTTVL
jgi:hypothetical protein